MSETAALNPVEVSGGLSESNKRVLTLLASGATAETAAHELGISGRALRSRVRHICDQLGLDTLMEALIWAARHGII